MPTYKDRLHPTIAIPAEDHRAEAIRILLALAEVDPTVSGTTLILSDGRTEYLDVEKLRQGGRG